MKSKQTLISILFLTLGTFGCQGADEHAAEEPGTAKVSVLEVRSGSVGLGYMASGTLRGSQTAVLTSKAPGYVQAVRFKPGDLVKAGQVLFVLEDSELGAKLRAAQAGLEEARQARTEAESGVVAAEAQARVATATYERFKTLQEKRAVAPQEFDEVEGNYNAAVAQKKMAEARLGRVRSALARAEAEVEAVRSYTQITAPFSGKVTERRVDLGNLAAPGTPLGVIERAGGLRAKVSIPEAHAGTIQVGDEAEVWIEGADEPVPGRVSEVQGVDVMSRAFMTEVSLPEDLPEMRGARPGMFVRVGFKVGDAEAILIPASSVLERGQLEMVYVVENERARTRLVTLGHRQGSQIEVLSGLSDGDVVVVNPGSDLREGMRAVTQ
jgi:RND family efflux transporter MFP subunit